MAGLAAFEPGRGQQVHGEQRPVGLRERAGREALQDHGEQEVAGVGVMELPARVGVRFVRGDGVLDQLVRGPHPVRRGGDAG